MSAVQLIAEQAALNEDETKLLEGNVRDATTDSPRASLASFRIKKYLSKAGKQVTDAVRELLVDVLSETVKKNIWG